MLSLHTQFFDDKPKFMQGIYNSLRGFDIFSVDKNRRVGRQEFVNTTENQEILAIPKKKSRFWTEEILSDFLQRWSAFPDLAAAPQRLNLLASKVDPFDIIKILARDFYHDQERIAERLAGSWLAPKLPARNRTVGVYYQRLRSGGAERVMASLTQIWKDAGFAVVLFTDEPPHEDDYEVSPDIQRVVLPALFDSNPDVVQNRLLALHEEVLKQKIGIFVHNSVYGDGFLFDVLTIKSCGIPVIAVNHGTFATSLASMSLQIKLATTVFRLLDSLIVLARYEENFWRVFDVPARYLPNPIQWNIRDIEVATLQSKNILWVGRLSYEKRVFDALEIFADVLLCEPDAKLFLVGKGETVEDLIAIKDRISELKLQASVVICGYHFDVRPIYLQAAVYLHTSQYESFSLTLIESKAHGVPAVLYDLPNLELLRVGRGAVTVGQRDAPAAARAIVKLLRDKDYRIEMGRAARESTEVFLASVNLSKKWTALFTNPAPGADDGGVDVISKEAVKNNFETMFNCIRAGVEWRDEHFLPKWEVYQRYMANARVAEEFMARQEVLNHYLPKPDVANHYLPKSQLATLIRKTTRNGLAGRLLRLTDSARKRLSSRPRKVDIEWDKQLKRHARYSRRLTAGLCAYGLLATIALFIR